MIHTPERRLRKTKTTRSSKNRDESARRGSPPPEPASPASRDTKRADAKGGKVGARERILRAALDEFARSGFDGTTTRSIAKIAGVTPPLILYHFESKEKLWLATV